MLELFSESVFMYPLLLCSIIAVAVIAHRLVYLRSSMVVPVPLVSALESGDTRQADQVLEVSDSALARVCRQVFQREQPDAATAVARAETCAREEVTKLQAGLTTLEVIITIAPLLGLLGTVSGLVTVFSGLGTEGGGPAPSGSGIARGIAEALNTTIAGLVVAVPAVVAHGYFQRRIDRMTVCMERVLHQAIIARYA
jgi:biopolymer transport protein ExbB